jgi:hypothetical protein
MRYYKFSIFLVLFITMGTFSGIFAVSTVQDNPQSVDINTTNKIRTDNSHTIYVSKNGTDRNDGLTMGKPKRNIQNAIFAANSGDTIKILPGTYTDSLQIDKNLIIIGDLQKNTIIDGNHENSCINIKHGINVTIINLTLKNGNSFDFGGGINNNGILTLKDSTIDDNAALYGGGIYNRGTITISGLTIKNNKGKYGGGGIWSDGTLTIKNSTITNNTVPIFSGGGIYNHGLMTIIGVTIKNNFATESGGGVYNRGTLTIEDSIITRNGATFGGGIINYSIITIYGSTITYNMANVCGGFNNLNTAYVDDITLIENNIPENYEGKPLIPS